jgi:carboxyl-terminal processing protease
MTTPVAARGRTRLASLGLASVAGLAFLLAACTSTPKPAPLTAEQRDLNLQSIDMVHSRIKQRHFDPEKVGEAWDAKHAEMRIRVEQAQYMLEARAAMNELIESLQQTHFGILPADAYEGTDAEEPSANDKTTGDRRSGGEIGVDLRRIGNDAVVTHVEPDSPAAAAGVKPGWAVESVDKRKVAPLIARIDKLSAGKTAAPLVAAMMLQSLAHGDVGKPQNYTFRAESGRTVRVAITPVQPIGKAQKFGNLPTMYLKTSRRIVPPGVGVLAFSIWFDPMKINSELEALLNECTDCQGIVIDLRGNIGGIGAMAMGMGRYFVDKPDQKLGTMIQREGKLNFVLNPTLKPFTKPVAILIDEVSASTSEIFAGGMQDLGRARIFGTRSPGAALPSIVEVLPNNDRLHYAFANYISFKGQTLEGHGVIPDEPVEPTREALLAGKDPFLDAAVAWITSQSASGSPSNN